MIVRIRFEKKEARRAAGFLMVLAGVGLLTTAMAGYSETPVWQVVHRDRDPSAGLPDPAPATASGRDSRAGPAANPRTGEPFARLVIPKIDLDLVVIEGTRAADLRKAPGHLAGSAAPGESDNCIIAGHRDLHFRRLGSLRPGDSIELETPGRRVRYRIEGTEVVHPSATEVLAPASEPLLTLVTCYPFRYVGPAPRRYVVRARMET